MSLDQTTPLRGANFRPDSAKAIVLALTIGTKVQLEREPENPYDENAIKILAEGEHIGFVAKEIAIALAPELDAPEAEYEAEVVGFNNPLTPVIFISVHNAYDGPPEDESLEDEDDQEELNFEA